MSQLDIGLVQFTAVEDPAANTAQLVEYIDLAVEGGAKFVLTPEASNIISSSKAHQDKVLKRQSDDQYLQQLASLAKARQVWLLIGSWLLKTTKGRFLNRSLLISPAGGVIAHYDKIHMFDATLSKGEFYRESAHFQAGNRAVVAETAFAKVGLSICYDLRFPRLYRTLAQAGAKILTVPSAFTLPTGKAHWHALLKARAIETGCFVVAPAMVGQHVSGRATYGHSLVVSPWGEVVADAGTAEGVTFATLDLSLVERARANIPSLTHDREFKLDDA